MVILALALVVVAGVVALNSYADPYGALGTEILPTLTASDRTAKADAIEALAQGPELVLLGSSRAMRYDPGLVAEKSGLRTFNAAVNGVGGTADMWAMTQFLNDVWPDTNPDYIWLLDVEAFVPVTIEARTADEPRLARYVGVPIASRGVREMARAVYANRGSMLSLATAKDSFRLAFSRDEAEKREVEYRKTIGPDGAMADRKWTEKEWKRRYPESVARYTEVHSVVYRAGLDAAAKAYFERTLAFMKAEGATPIIVLTPMHPDLMATVAPLGWTDRHREVVAYLASLRDTYSLTVLDLCNEEVFGGDPRQWYDGVHPTAVNTRRAMLYILDQVEGQP